MTKKLLWKIYYKLTQIIIWEEDINEDFVTSSIFNSIVLLFIMEPISILYKLFTWNRPLVAGLVTGIILGQPLEGAIIGASINLIYLGFISAGGAQMGDPAFAGYVGTA